MRKYIWIGLGIALVLFLWAWRMVHRSTTGFMQSASHVARSHEIHLTFEHIGTLVNDIDTSHRGNIISEELILLAPYNGAVNRIRDKIGTGQKN